jgi:Fe-S-cluster containining protein
MSPRTREAWNPAPYQVKNERDKNCRRAHTLFDHKWAAVLKQRGIAVTCSKGCSACCSEPIYTFDKEARLVANAIPKEEMEGVKDRLRNWILRAEAAKMLDVPEPHVFAYRQVGLPCPLLKDGLCLVYKDRPLGCRSHCAVGDPALCKDDTTRLQQKFVMSPELVQDVFAPPLTGDHLGVFLADYLLGVKLPSAARVVVDYYK